MCKTKYPPFLSLLVSLLALLILDNYFYRHMLLLLLAHKSTRAVCRVHTEVHPEHCNPTVSIISSPPSFTLLHTYGRVECVCKSSRPTGAELTNTNLFRPPPSAHNMTTKTGTASRPSTPCWSRGTAWGAPRLAFPARTPPAPQAPRSETWICPLCSRRWPRLCSSREPGWGR